MNGYVGPPPGGPAGGFVRDSERIGVPSRPVEPGILPRTIATPACKNPRGSCAKGAVGEWPRRLRAERRPPEGKLGV